MFSFFKELKYKSIHRSVMQKLESIDWQSEQAFELAKQSYYTVHEAWAKDSLIHMTEHVTEPFMGQYLDTPELWKQTHKSYSGLQAEINGFYVVDVQLSAIELEKGACQCSDDLAGTIKVAIKATMTDAHQVVTKKTFDLWEFVWEDKNWKIDSYNKF